MSGAVPDIGAFLQHKALGLIRQRKHERAITTAGENLLLYKIQLNVENLPELFRAKRAEGDDFVQPVHELRRKSLAGRFNPATVDLAGYRFSLDNVEVRSLPLHC